MDGGKDSQEKSPRTLEDVQSDPHLDDPLDTEQGEDAADEGTQSDWTAEGGATPDGPATDVGADDAQR